MTKLPEQLCVLFERGFTPELLRGAADLLEAAQAYDPVDAERMALRGKATNQQRRARWPLRPLDAGEWDKWWVETPEGLLDWCAAAASSCWE